MKIRFLVSTLLLSIINLHCALPSYQPPKDYIHIACTFEPIKRGDEKRTHPHIPGPKIGDEKLTKDQTTSTNWAGYVAANDLNNPGANSVSAVYGSWIVPSIKKSKKNTYSSIWIGIDGYSNGTVEQIGTEHDSINGVQRHYAWFEMYPGPSFRINGFPVNVGDSISASVEYTGGGVFVLKLYNNTQSVMTTIPTSSTTSTTAKRSSAEWIVEAPWLNKTLPLSNFGTAFLSDCSATINDILATLQNASWSHIALIMVTPKGVVKATPSAIGSGNASFSVAWAHK